MRTETLRIMASVERRLNKLIELEGRHCGHDELVQKANEQRDRLEAFIEREVEALCEKAGVL